MKSKIIQSIVIFMLSIFLCISAMNIDKYNESIKDNTLISDEEGLHLWEQGQIIYKGQKYQYKNNIKTYLLMGIDSMEEVYPKQGATNGGQSDALFLLIVDDEAKSWSVVAINRNTMTDVDVYDETGQCLWSTSAQICVQHGFGDGMEQSCERTVSTVSRTLFDLPIDGYFSINMGALPQFNDALSGVTLTSMDTIDVPDVGVHIDEGQQVTLQGMDAWAYLVWRDDTKVDSATRRLERQEQYIQAAYSQIESSGVVDKIGIVQSTLDITNRYTVIDMSVVEVGYQILSYDKNLEQIYNIPGTETMGDRFVEYHMDEDAAKDLLISLYYIPVE